MTPEHFSALGEAARQYLEDLSHTNPTVIAACKSGEDFEVCVRDAVAAILLREVSMLKSSMNRVATHSPISCMFSIMGISMVYA